jgi:hypothetical protein
MFFDALAALLREGGFQAVGRSAWIHYDLDPRRLQAGGSNLSTSRRRSICRS